MRTIKIVAIMCGLVGLVSSIIMGDYLVTIWTFAYTVSIFNWE